MFSRAALRLPHLLRPSNACRFSVAKAVAARADEALVSCTSFADHLQVEWEDGRAARFHYAWLLDNNPNLITSSNQKAPRRIDVDSASNKPENVHVDDTAKQVLIQWEHGAEGEVAAYDSEWLRKFAHEEAVFEEKRRELRAQKDYLQGDKEDIYQPFGDILTSEDELYSWLSCINEKGLCVLRNVPQEEGAVLRVSGLVGPPSHTIYGDTFSVKVDPDPINIAFSDAPLEFHMDLAYFESPPGLQFLHAIQFDEAIIGGLSTFIDAHAVAEELKERDAESFEVLRRVPATFVKDHIDRAEPVQLFYQRPHINTTYDGEVNAVFWAPPFEGPLHIPFGDVEAYYRAYGVFRDLLNSEEMKEKYGHEFRLKPGDLVTFNNRRMLHGRTAFTSANGTRHLQGTYVDIDRFLNKLRVLGLSRKKGSYGSAYWTPSERRVGISCHR